jgi:hypothetical protein
MRCPALTLSANLKTEQAFDVTSNPVVVRLDDSGASGFIDELDEMLAADCVHELVIHGFAQTTKRVVDKAQFEVTTRRATWLCYNVYISIYTSTDDYNSFSADR